MQKTDNSLKVKIKVSRSSATYSQGEYVEGKILVVGIKRKLNSLGIKAVGAYIPSSNPKAVEACPQLGKMSKTNIFEYENTLLKDYVVSGSIKKSFKFLLDRNADKSFPETYYGFLYAVKVLSVYLVCDLCQSKTG